MLGDRGWTVVVTATLFFLKLFLDDSFGMGACDWLVGWFSTTIACSRRIATGIFADLAREELCDLFNWFQHELGERSSSICIIVQSNRKAHQDGYQRLPYEISFRKVSIHCCTRM